MPQGSVKPRTAFGSKRRWRGRMRSRMIRRGLVAAAILAVVVLIGVVALPFIASTQIVKDRLALELSRWSGYRVTLGRDPIIRVWPSMQAILGDVKLSEWSE